MPTAAVALRAAIHAALSSDAGLAAVLGGPRVYDAPPKAPDFPYVTLGDAQLRNLAIDDDGLTEHRLTLHAWSRQGGHREAHAIAGALLSALENADLAVDGSRLVNCRFATADVRREPDGRTYRAIVRFRAVTQPAV